MTDWKQEARIHHPLTEDPLDDPGFEVALIDLLERTWVGICDGCDYRGLKHGPMRGDWTARILEDQARKGRLYDRIELVLREGERRAYSFDVTNPDAPVLHGVSVTYAPKAAEMVRTPALEVQIKIDQTEIAWRLQVAEVSSPMGAHPEGTAT